VTIDDSQFPNDAGPYYSGRTRPPSLTPSVPLFTAFGWTPPPTATQPTGVWVVYREAKSGGSYVYMVPFLDELEARRYADEDSPVGDEKVAFVPFGGRLEL
jgi:hypothetical protein